MAHKYHKVLPLSNNLNGFIEHDSIDFLLTADPDRALVPNSISLEYTVQVFKTAGTRVTAAIADDIVMESASVFFDQMRVEVENKGQIENLLNYPRYCHMVTKSTKQDLDLCNSVDQLEGNFMFRINGQTNIQQLTTQTGGAQENIDPTFVIAPKICLNRSVGGEYKFGEMGYIKLSTVLSRNEKALFGNFAAATDSSYKLLNVAVRYETRPVDPSNKLPLMCFSYKSIKADVNSQHNMIQAVVPSTSCSGVIMSFINQTRENVFRNNSNSCEVLRGIRGLRFLYNSNLGERIAYELEDINEMQKQAISALSENGTNGVTRRLMAANDAFMLGVDFKSLVNLNNVNTQVSIDLDSSYANNNHVAYLYFLEVLQL